MAEIKVLHMADLHLEWPFAGTGGDRQRSRLRREELKAVFTAIIDLAEREEVDLLLIAGDLYEHQHATRGTAKFVDQQFRRLRRTRIFVAPGNHDPYFESSYYATYPWVEHLHIFGPEPERVELELNGVPVSIFGWGFDAWEVDRWRLHNLPPAAPGRIQIGLIHGGEGAYHPFRPADLAALRADYIALGHIHAGGVVLEEEGRVVARYAGSPEALGFGEPGPHGVWLGTVSQGRSDWRFVETGIRRYVTGEVDVSGAVAVEDLVEAVRAFAEPAERQQHCYRLRLTGEIDPELVVDPAFLEQKLASDFYLVKLEDRTRPAFDLEQLSRERTARGLFVQRLLAMAEQEADPEVRLRVERALALGLTALTERGAGR